MTAVTTLPAGFLAPTAAAARRRTGRGLLAFGLVGLVLLALAGALVLGSLGALGTTAADLEAQRARLISMLGPAEEALDGAADTATNAGASLSASGDAARDAADLVTQLAQAMDGMASAAQVEVLGVRPFGALADDLTGVATRSRTLATDLVTTATALDTNVSDTGNAAADLRALAVELRVLRAEFEAGTTAGAANSMEGTLTLARIVIVGLLLWLAVPAVIATWLGWRWLRS
jgi:hypothetical protein